MDEQMNWMATHPGTGAEALSSHLKDSFSDVAAQGVASEASSFLELVSRTLIV
jgi:hypothetical protein